MQPINHPTPKTPPHRTAKDYQNPKIHSDLITLYTRYFDIHRNMSKYLRIAILEAEILGSISTMMRLTIQVNVMKAAAIKPSPAAILGKMHELRGHIENIKAFSTLLWKTKAISEGFFIQVMASTEDISRQIVGWEKYLSQNMLKN